MAWTNLLGQVRVGIRGSVSQSQTQSLLLDTYSGAAAAYSLRKLNTSYTGSAIRVRRSSDNTEQNIGFNADGTLNTLALLAFTGTSNGFVTTWYDQSSNNNHATQNVSNLQPQIVSAGSILLVNNKPSIRFDNSLLNLTSLISPNNYNYHSFVGSRSSTSDKLYGLSGQNGYKYALTLWSDNKYYLQAKTNAYQPSNSTDNSIGQLLLTGRNINGVMSIYKNSNIIPSTEIFDSSINPSITGIGQYFNSFNNAKCSLQEMVFYNNNQTSQVNIESNMNSYYSIYATDTDAQAFINAASITDGTQISAIDTLVTSLKSAGIWTKMRAIYPFVGGSATSHKLNLKDPRDLDDAFRLAFNGGWTHNSNGATPNGTNGYAKTFFVGTNLSMNSSSLSIYNRSVTPTTKNVVDFGYFRLNSSYVSNFFTTYYDGTYGFRVNSWGSLGLPQTSPQGFYNGNRTNSSDFNFFKNGSKVSTLSDSTVGKSQINYQFHLGCLFIDGAYYDNFSTNNYAFAHIGDGLTDSESTTFYNTVQEFQTSLGRQV
jgi:hypothetical protein